MAQIDRTTQRLVVSTKMTGNSAVEQHLRGLFIKRFNHDQAFMEVLKDAGEGGSRWSPTSSSLLSENEHEQKDFDSAHHQKKSVLTKVKENAIKLKHSLSNKKKPGEVEDGNSTPPSSVLEDDNEEDAEFLGAPMYESENSPEGYKETLRQHPRADPVISENHLLPSSVKQSSEHEEEKLHNLNPRKTEAEAVYEMPASLKKLSLVDTKSHPPFESSSAYCSSPRKILAEPTAVNSNKKMTRSMTEKFAPTHLNSSKPDHPMLTPQGRFSRETPFSTPEVLAAKTTTMAVGGIEQEQVPNKGVCVEESSIRKFEPGEKRAQEKIPADIGVLEKMKETVSSLLWTNEPSQSTAMHSPPHASSYSPTTTNAPAGEEAESVRTLQPN